MKFKNLKTTPRIQMLLESALVGSPIWDMCCDHGLLGLRALAREEFGEVHFVDQVPSIMKGLELKLQSLSSQGLLNFYQLHCQKAESLSVPIEGSCIIAGVGGKTISIILSSLHEADLLYAKRLVLSAHSDEALMLSYFESDKFKKVYRMVEKKEVSDRLKIRSIYVLDRT